MSNDNPVDQAFDAEFAAWITRWASIMDPIYALAKQQHAHPDRATYAELAARLRTAYDFAFVTECTHLLDYATGVHVASSDLDGYEKPLNWAAFDIAEEYALKVQAKEKVRS